MAPMQDTHQETRELFEQMLGLDGQGVYRKSHMIRRLAQFAILADRGITFADLARELETSREVVRLYFLDQYPGTPGRHTYAELSVPATHRGDNRSNLKARRIARLRYVKRIVVFERAVECALERISSARHLSPPRVIGTPEEDYIQHEVVMRDLMSAPPHRGLKGVSI